MLEELPRHPDDIRLLLMELRPERRQWVLRCCLAEGERAVLTARWGLEDGIRHARKAVGEIHGWPHAKVRVIEQRAIHVLWGWFQGMHDSMRIRLMQDAENAAGSD